MENYSIINGKRIERKMIPCEICGRPTEYVGTKRCDGCWHMEGALSDFIQYNKKKAKEWLQDQLDKIKDD